MTNEKLIEDRIKHYLADIASRIPQPQTRRTEVIQDLEAHIYDALHARSQGAPSISDLEAVLAEMDPPESYGEPAPVRSPWQMPVIAVSIVVVAAIVVFAVLRQREHVLAAPVAVTPPLVEEQVLTSPESDASLITKVSIAKTPPSARIASHTYTNDTVGFAGITPQGNQYTFTLDQVGTNAVLQYWAAGDIGTDAYGQVILHTPEGKELKIADWQPTDFTMTTSDIASYEKLPVKTCDLSKHVDAPGTYTVEFKYTGGTVGLSIQRVELSIR